jgi:pimeloyl-ACP methyl ester carboxylesterase
VTVLWGECDTALGTDLLRGTDRFATHLAIHRIPDAGHFVHQERPDEVNRLLIEALRGRAEPT